VRRLFYLSRFGTAMDDSSDRTHATLAAQLLAPATFEAFAADCRTLLDEEIKRKGMTVRTAFRVVRKIKPDILDRVVRELMPEFLDALEPCHADFKAGSDTDFKAYLIAHDDRVAEAALRAADVRAQRIHSRSIHAAYNRVRGRAKSEILPAVPAFAQIMTRHLGHR